MFGCFRGTRSLDDKNRERNAARVDLPDDWRGFDEPTIIDAVWHFKTNAYANWITFFFAPRTMTGLVNTWIWRSFGFQRKIWLRIGFGLHVVNAGLIWTLLWNAGFSPRGIGLYVVTAVFLIHPIQIPAILQPSVRAGVQSATFAYAALLCLSLGFWPVAVLSQFLAVKSKEDAWMYLVFWPMVWYFSNGT